jgi:MFS family permease
MTAPALSVKELRRVVIAAAVGNVIEWYDFYIFGSLAALLSVKFFAAGASGSALIKTVGTFTAGFLIRPFGAFVFGRIGDIVGRKYTFLITLSGMGLSTALIGLVPSYAKIGALAGIVLLLLRLIQGLCLGGEYGGAITYVAEHAPDEKRGYYTGWLQTSPTLGIVVSLVVIIVTREIVGTEAFNAWGWRIPFLLSLLMVAIAIYIRLQLAETPIFQAIKAKGQTATNPWREAFLSENLKYVLIASVVVIGEGVVWYSSQFWALYFVQQVQKPDVLTPAIITGAALLIATPSLIFFGWLSDRIGRKPIILAGFLLAAVTYYPLYTALGNAANPANLNYPLAILIVAIMVSYVGMVYGPIGAFLAEYFPARIRYTSVSVPYHIGNGWGGGLVPVITTAAYVSAQTAGLSMSQSLGHALVYPIAVPAVAFVLSLFLMPETRKISIWQPAEVRAGARG